jgi:predicted RNA-binding Zn-ribbon protein involved in translation (DUF1610 family)
MSRKINLEKVLASLDTICPKCGKVITPAEMQRIDFERMKCPACGELPYATVTKLLRHELRNDDGEHGGTAELIKNLVHIRKTKRITRSEFLKICRWKSPRAVKHYNSSHK